MTEERGLLIGGQWRTGTGGGRRDIRSPYDRSLVGRAWLADERDVAEAMHSASEAFVAHYLPPAQRAEILRGAAQRIGSRAEDLARLIALECGKPIGEARAEAFRTVGVLQEAAEEARRITGHMVPVDAVPGSEDRIAFTMQFPIGVVGAITPFNGPLLSPAHKVASAIAAGNSVVLKPSEIAPLSALELAAELVDAGLPPDLLQVTVGGSEVGEALVGDPRLAMIAFTGSTRVGLRIRERLGLRKSILELGGNAPLIVHQDADVRAAAQAAVSGAFGYAGQVCISVQRILVHEDVRPAFEEIYVSLVDRLKVGDPLDQSTDVGPMISREKAIEAEKQIAQALDRGARLLAGGRLEGLLMWPTVLADPDPSEDVVCREAFAPVVSIMSYKDLGEAIEVANSTEYGLQAGVFTGSLDVALEAARALRFGAVILNDTSRYRVDLMPYGGVKSSGIGKEGPRYAIREMMEERLIVLRSRS